MQVFINFITAAANDVCKEKKRATINADDVFQALEDLEFAELLPALKESFEGGPCSWVYVTGVGQALPGRRTGVCSSGTLPAQAQHGIAVAPAWAQVQLCASNMA
jgi:hypothetical protein